MKVEEVLRYMKGEMAGVGDLSGAKSLMVLVVGRELGTGSEVSGCSEKLGTVYR